MTLIDSKVYLPNGVKSARLHLRFLLPYKVFYYYNHTQLTIKSYKFFPKYI